MMETQLLCPTDAAKVSLHKQGYGVVSAKYSPLCQYKLERYKRVPHRASERASGRTFM